MLVGALGLKENMKGFLALGFAIILSGGGCNKGTRTFPAAPEPVVEKATKKAPSNAEVVEAAYRDYIAAMHDLAETIEKSESPEAQKAAAGKVRIAMNRLNQMKVNETEDRNLKEQLGDELKKANIRLGTVLTNLMARGKTPVVDLNSFQAAPKVAGSSD